VIIEGLGHVGDDRNYGIALGSTSGPRANRDKGSYSGDPHNTSPIPGA
jgi:hypothetical protein